MRLSRRLLPLLTSIFAFLLPAGVVHPAWAQTAATKTPDSRPSGLPPKWDEAVQSLADKVSAAAGPARKISMEVKNMSSLNVAEANAVQQELQSALRHRQVRLTSTAHSELSLSLTFSEGVQGFIWSAELSQGNERQTFLAGVPRQSLSPDGGPNASLTLDARLIWDQREKFIDFGLQKPGNSDSWLNILAMNQVETYKLSDSAWHVDQAIPISRETPARRDGTGGFDLEKLDTFWFDMDCIGPGVEPKNRRCSMWYSITPAKEVPIRIRGREESVGTILKAKCGISSIVIASGTGDWTQPDTLQGFLLAGPAQQAVPSGSPIPFEGPVLNVRPDWKENTVRAIVHNLKTGNYEGYLVAATCSH